jgi:mannose-6-phosphate isomerase-like protein (cupin superfamily)
MNEPALRFEGVDGEVAVGAGDCLTQPAGVPHNLVDRSADLKLLEIALPQPFGTVDLVAA